MFTTFTWFISLSLSCNCPVRYLYYAEIIGAKHQPQSPGSQSRSSNSISRYNKVAAERSVFANSPAKWTSESASRDIWRFACAILPRIIRQRSRVGPVCVNWTQRSSSRGFRLYTEKKGYGEQGRRGVSLFALSALFCIHYLSHCRRHHHWKLLRELADISRRKPSFRFPTEPRLDVASIVAFPSENLIQNNRAARLNADSIDSQTRT